MILENWKQLFAPRVLKRGEDYYLDGAVKSIHQNGEWVDGLVSGTEDYQVEIQLQEGRVVEMVCSCPYAEGGMNCKHMAAVLYQLNEREEAEEAEYDTITALENRREKLGQVVNSMSEAAAKGLLLRLGLASEIVETEIRIAVLKRIPKEQLWQWKKRIRQLPKEYGHRHGYIDYRNSYDYCWELQDILSRAVPDLLEAGMPMEGFHLICTAISQACQVDMDDDGGLALLFDTCGDLWSELLGAANKGQRRKLYLWFAENARNSQWNCGQDVVEKVLLEEFHDRKLLESNLELLDKWIQTEGAKHLSYHLEYYIGCRLRTMEELGANREQKDAYMRQFPDLWVARKYFLDQTLEQQQYDAAIGMLRESIHLDSDHYGLVAEHYDQLMDLLRSLGRNEELGKTMKEFVCNHGQSNLKYVLELKHMTNQETWLALREELLCSKGVSPVAGDLMVEEGMYRRLMDRILESNSAWDMDRYASVLKRHYPEEMLEFYLSYLRRQMAEANARNRYAQLIERLKSLRTYPDGQEKTKQLAAEWRRTYPRRSAMLEELNKRGY